MGKYKIGNVSFGTIQDKQIWILNGVIDSLDYIGRETSLSNTENELRKLSIKDIQKVIKTIQNANKHNSIS